MTSQIVRERFAANLLAVNVRLSVRPRSKERRNQAGDKRWAGHEQHLEYGVGEVSITTGGSQADQQQPADDCKEHHAHPPEEVRQGVVWRRFRELGVQQENSCQRESDPEGVSNDIQRTDHHEKERRKNLHIGVVAPGSEFFKSLSTNRHLSAANESALDAASSAKGPSDA